MQECQWLLKLHTFGLLRASFQPPDEIRTARSLWKERSDLVAMASSTIQRVQKILVQMNVQLSNVSTDLSGVSGMKIVEAILAGKRDPTELASLVEPEVKASKEDIAKSLEGNWRKELLFSLGEKVDMYEFYQQKIVLRDQELQRHLMTMESRIDPEEQPLGRRPKNKQGSKNAPQFDLRSELYRLTGVDWTQVNGIDVLTAQTVLSEVGVGLSEFPSERHFASWLGLTPTDEKSGGRILNRHTRTVVNRATTAFRMAASTLLRSQSYLGAQYRRLRTRSGAPKAITAMARKLSCLYFRLIRDGQQYVDKGTEYYEAKYREQQIRLLVKKAKQLGLVISSVPTA